MAFVGKQGTNRGANHNRNLRHCSEHCQHECGEYRIARALRHYRDHRITQCFIALSSTATVEGGCTVKPPGYEGCNREGAETRDERMWTERYNYCEGANIGKQTDSAEA